MPISRQNTPPTSRTVEQHGVMDSLSKWTADVDSDEEHAEKAKHEVLKPDDSFRGRCRAYMDPDSDFFNVKVGIVIILNSIVIGLETTFGREYFTVFENVFNAFFVMEMCVRMNKLGWRYFMEAWNVFDFLLVVVGTLDLWVLPLYDKVDEGGGPRVTSNVGYSLSAMRLLRILRVTRVLRVIRLFRMFNQLNLIMQAFSKAFQVVLLVTLLVMILDYVVAILLVQCIGNKAELWEGEDEDHIVAWFGSIPRAMQTLFQIMTLSDWDIISITLAKVLPAWTVYGGFVCYILITSYTSSSLIIGIITDSLITAQTDYEVRTSVKVEEKRKALSMQLRTFLMELHEDEMDENAYVPVDDLKSSLKGDSDLVAKLANIKVFIDEKGLGDLVDRTANGAPTVNIIYFVEKLTHLTGMASASQVSDLKYEMARVQQFIDIMLKEAPPLPESYSAAKAKDSDKVPKQDPPQVADPAVAVDVRKEETDPSQSGANDTTPASEAPASNASPSGNVRSSFQKKNAPGTGSKKKVSFDLK
eukprot:TRINITY_DN54179_c0_g1_i1.p1 TRINITY_DN54179_c0_g1~~TRINITY_DN54179_c0_g1_i1.p1  ORF type:complete len:530 (-),score=109.61 TRINITY_DN54179_c0_g1_i1:200-1789(-)